MGGTVFIADNAASVGFEYAHRAQGTTELRTGLTVGYNSEFGSAFVSLPAWARAYFLRYLYATVGCSFNWYSALGMGGGLGAGGGIAHTFPSGMFVSTGFMAQWQMSAPSTPTNGYMPTPEQPSKHMGVSFSVGYRF